MVETAEDLWGWVVFGEENWRAVVIFGLLQWVEHLNTIVIRMNCFLISKRKYET